MYCTQLQSSSPQRRKTVNLLKQKSLCKALQILVDVGYVHKNQDGSYTLPTYGRINPYSTKLQEDKLSCLSIVIQCLFVHTPSERNGQNMDWEVARQWLPYLQAILFAYEEASFLTKALHENVKFVLIDTLRNYASLLFSDGSFAEGERLVSRGLRILKELLPHEYTASTALQWPHHRIALYSLFSVEADLVSNLGRIALERNQPQKALDYMNEAQNIRQRSMSVDTKYTSTAKSQEHAMLQAISKLNIAAALIIKNEPNQAKKLLEEINNSIKQKIGVQSDWEPRVLGNIAWCSFMLGDFKSAEELLQTATLKEESSQERAR